MENRLSSDSNLLSQDVSRLIWLTDTKEKIKITQFIVKHYVESTEPYHDGAILKKKSTLFRDLMQICRLNKWLEPAKEIWNDRIFMDRVGYIDTQGNKLAFNMPTITLTYLDLLYKKKLYQEVIEEVQKIAKGNLKRIYF